MKPSAAFFWRKLDHPGHDSCRLFKLSGGWRLSGAAVFREAGRLCHFRYDVLADALWKTRSASVHGYLGNRAVDIRITRAGDRWKAGREVLERPSGCVDVDHGFTPATNLIAPRRLSLEIGERAQAPAAYLSFPGMRFVRLPQVYRRIGRREYEYEAPTVGYAGKLRVSARGAVLYYPGLFEMLAPGQA